MCRITAFMVVLFFLGVTATSAAVAKDQTQVFYGPTTESEHLWRIAVKLKTSFLVNEDQVMLALLKYNPHAFDIENVNALKPGVVLKLPRLELVKYFSPRYAYFEIKRQNEYWKNRTAKHRKISRKIVESREECREEIVVTMEEKPKTSPQNIAKVLPTPGRQETYPPAVITRLNTLEMQNVTMQHQVNAMGHELAAIKQQLISAKALGTENTKIVINKSSNISSFKDLIGQLQLKLGKVGFIAAVVLAFFLFIFFVRGLVVRGGAPKPSRKMIEPELAPKTLSKEEYDFMASPDSIPAKINLAHAYLDMGNLQAAKDILNEVVKLGNPTQQAEAKALLDRLPK